MLKKKKSKKKGFRVIDVILFTFSAVFVLDSLGLATTIGWSSIIWWIILGVMFFLPYGMITAELSTTYTNGGIYQWVKRGLGFKNGARTNYCYWINVAFWMPSVYLILGSTFIYSISPALVAEDWFIWVNVAIALAATWITLIFNSINMEKAKLLPNIGAIIKGVLVVVMLIAMFIFLANPNLFGHQSETSGIIADQNAPNWTPATNPNDHNSGGIVPNFGATLGIIGIIVYNMCGFELSQNLGDDIQEVKKSVPKALLIGGITILFSYLIASIPVFVTNQVSNTGYQAGGYQNGIITTLLAGLPKEFVIVIAIFLAFTLFTNMLTWTLGANGAIAEAAENKQFSKFFAYRNKHNAPIKSAFVLTIVASIAILVSGLMEYFGAGNAYYILFSFSLIIFFIPYIMIFISYARLRTIDANITRPFAIKNNAIAKCLGYLCLAIVIIACITQVLDIQIASTITINPNADLGDWGGFFGTIGGVVVCLIIGDILIWYANRDKNKSRGGQAKQFSEAIKKIFNVNNINNQNKIKEKKKKKKTNFSRKLLLNKEYQMHVLNNINWKQSPNFIRGFYE